MEIYDVIGSSEIDKFVVVLPPFKMDRKLYLEVKKAMSFIGGKWVGGAVNGFVFDENPTEMLKAIKNKEYDITTKKSQQYFGTPIELARKMVEYAELSQHDQLLEPSAGQGSILKAVLEQEYNKQPHKMDYCENLPLNVKMLESAITDKRVSCVAKDFISLDGAGVYNKIIANPPFSKNQDIIHFFQMLKHLSRFGILVCIVSNHHKQDSDFYSKALNSFLYSDYTKEYFNVTIEDIPQGTFKESGTMVGATLVVVESIGGEVEDLVEVSEHDCNSELEDFLKVFQ